MKRGRVGEDLTGRTFGYFTVLGLDHSDNFGNRYWKCRCDCSKITVVAQSNLKSGNTQSCGCHKKELINRHVRKNRRLITYNGITKTLTQWAEYLDINMATLSYRLKKCDGDIEKACEVDVKKRKNHTGFKRYYKTKAERATLNNF